MKNDENAEAGLVGHDLDLLDLNEAWKADGEPWHSALADDLDIALGLSHDLISFPVAKVIRKEGGKWVLYDSSGKKKLGTHNSKKEAEAQETAINLSKARKAGHKIPK